MRTAWCSRYRSYSDEPAAIMRVVVSDIVASLPESSLGYRDLYPGVAPTKKTLWEQIERLCEFAAEEAKKSCPADNDKCKAGMWYAEIMGRLRQVGGGETRVCLGGCE
jgi:hypothetical protein